MLPYSSTTPPLSSPRSESDDVGRSESVDRGRVKDIPSRTVPRRQQTFVGVLRHSDNAARDQLARTERWFDVHLAKTQMFMDSFRRGRNTNRVRIAVLDSGFNKAHPDPQVQEIANGNKGQQRIMEYHSWVQGLPGDEDTYGHGTYCATTLNRVAPTAALYIARVCRNSDEMDENAIADAIRHAVTNWKVDIITMSFGFEYLPNGDRFRNEIKAASDAGVLMFAAASVNEGKNIGRTYPARDAHVFSVYGTSADGALSSFNPYLSCERNHAILGEHVMASWCGNEHRRLSGTNVATPIMAGIAALVLEFVRQPAIEGQQEIRKVEKLNTMNGMRKILFEMKNEGEEVAQAVLAQNCLYVTPWDFLAAKWDEDEEEARKRIAQRIHHVLRYVD